MSVIRLLLNVELFRKMSVTILFNKNFKIPCLLFERYFYYRIEVGDNYELRWGKLVERYKKSAPQAMFACGADLE